MESDIKRAAEIIKNADALLIGAGAGIGVDSGLPDFRGKKGFWKEYPVLKERKKSFQDMANPIWFEINPKMAWGFYGHRLNLYRKTKPHKGFQILKEWIEKYNKDYFIFTSNVDGQFQKAGFSNNKIVECHGSIHYVQCSKNCSDYIDFFDEKVIIDEDKLMLESKIPRCKNCGEILRPNILMFNDWNWLEERTDKQMNNYSRWKNNTKNIVVIEIGAGKNIPTVRLEMEKTSKEIIRINPRESNIKYLNNVNSIGLNLGAEEAISLINKYI